MTRLESTNFHKQSSRVELVFSTKTRLDFDFSRNSTSRFRTLAVVNKSVEIEGSVVVCVFAKNLSVSFS